jgi:small subunit ribosomal protein S15
MSTGVLWMPRLFNYGVGEVEKELLFEHLPPLTAEVGGMRQPSTWDLPRHEEAEKTEMMKSNMLAKVIDLRNANAGGISYENRKRIVAVFSEPGKPGDAGRSEVQGTKQGLLLSSNSHMHL